MKHSSNDERISGSGLSFDYYSGSRSGRSGGG